MFYITNFFEVFMTKSRVTCTISLFFLEKKSEIWNAFTFFEKWKVKQIFLSLFSRNEKWNDFLFHSFREVKVKLKYLETEIERKNLKKNNLENSRETRLSLVSALAFHQNDAVIKIQLPICRIQFKSAKYSAHISNVKKE